MNWRRLFNFLADADFVFLLICYAIIGAFIVAAGVWLGRLIFELLRHMLGAL